MSKNSLPMFALMLYLHGCASLPEIGKRTISQAVQNTEDTELGEYAVKLTEQHPGESGFHLLPDGLDAFVARAALAKFAERSIDAQYYHFNDDLVGRLFVGLLIEAANRGVRVRLLVDDMALDANKDLSAVLLDHHSNIEIRIFNPFARGSSRFVQYFSRFGTVTRRMHNKSFTVDNQFTVIGGRNIGNEYFEADPDLMFSDLDVLALGPVVKNVSASFDKYWNAAASFPIASLIKNADKFTDLEKIETNFTHFIAAQANTAYMQAVRNSQLATKLANHNLTFDWGRAEVVYDDPAKISASRDRSDLMLSTQLTPHIDAISKELIIFTPYFVPGKAGVEALRKLRQRGVKIRVLTNSLGSTDVSAVHAGYARYRRVMLQAGIELYELDNTLTAQQRKEKKGFHGSSKASLHAKSFVIDRREVFIGSLNLDPRSFVENTEIGLIVESRAIAANMIEWFDRNIQQIAFRLQLEPDMRGDLAIVWYREREGSTIRYTAEPNTSFWRRLGIGILRLLPIESQL